MKIYINDLIEKINECSPTELSRMLLQLGHENVIKDQILELELTPNRGDCFSLLGILRDLSALADVNKEFDTHKGVIGDLDLDFTNEIKNICPSITFTEIEIEEIPLSYKKYLNNFFEKLDTKKVNFFTDVSNYLSYEIGQPTHCYDANKIGDSIKLTEINENQNFKTLVGKEIQLEGKNAVFKIEDKVVNLAGIMGGASSACSENTTRILLECAYFEPKSIIGKNLKYGLNSEAAHKFERGVDPSIHSFAIRRFLKIVDDHAKIKSIKKKNFNYASEVKKEINYSLDKINKILGIEISKSEFMSNLIRLGFDVTGNKIYIPFHRHDIENENDISEEIARTIGYDNIKSQTINLPNKVKSKKSYINTLKDYLIDNGFYEVINFPFVEKNNSESIKVDNPLDSTKRFLRTDMKESLIKNLIYNERRQKDSIKLFEISNIYLKNGYKHQRIAIIASGRVGKNYLEFSKKINDDYIKKILSLFKEYKDIEITNISRDKINSKLKNQILYCEFDFINKHTFNIEYKKKKTESIEFNIYKKISEYPSTTRDLSFAINKPDKYEELYKKLLIYSHDSLKESYVFDFFHNEKSNQLKVGFRFIFQCIDRTLKDSEIDSIINDIISKSLEIESVEIPGLK